MQVLIVYRLISFKIIIILVYFSMVVKINNQGVAVIYRIYKSILIHKRLMINGMVWNRGEWYA